jgi:hypothetical protein
MSLIVLKADPNVYPLPRFIAHASDLGGEVWVVYTHVDRQLSVVQIIGRSRAAQIVENSFCGFAAFEDCGDDEVGAADHIAAGEDFGIG